MRKTYMAPTAKLFNIQTEERVAAYCGDMHHSHADIGCYDILFPEQSAASCFGPAINQGS